MKQKIPYPRSISALVMYIFSEARSKGLVYAFSENISHGAQVGYSPGLKSTAVKPTDNIGLNCRATNNNSQCANYFMMMELNRSVLMFMSSFGALQYMKQLNTLFPVRALYMNGYKQ